MKKRQEVKGTKCEKTRHKNHNQKQGVLQTMRQKFRPGTERVRQHAADTLIVTAVCVPV